MTLSITPSTYGDAARLVAELDDDLLVRYPGDTGLPVIAHAEQFEAAVGGGFLVARIDGEDAGCAGLRSLGNGVAELKRMWVRPAYRRRGLASALLHAVEDLARSLGHRELWLETGHGQPEAIALYEHLGYTPVARFGQYACASDSVHLGRAL